MLPTQGKLRQEGGEPHGEGPMERVSRVLRRAGPEPTHPHFQRAPGICRGLGVGRGGTWPVAHSARGTRHGRASSCLLPGCQVSGWPVVPADSSVSPPCTIAVAFLSLLSLSLSFPPPCLSCPPTPPPVCPRPASGPRGLCFTPLVARKAEEAADPWYNSACWAGLGTLPQRARNALAFQPSKTERF